MTSTIIDVSAAQGVIDWPRVAGCDGAIVKATEGSGFVDQQFTANFRGAASRNLLLGTYHFAHPNELLERDPETEAEHYVACVKALWNGSPLIFALDIEDARKVHVGPAFVSWCRRFVERLEALTLLIGWIYTGGPFWHEHVGIMSAEDAAFFVVRHLWIAAYVDDLTPYIALTPWCAVGWTLHQWSGDTGPRGTPAQHYAGIHGNVDTSRFDGSIADLRALIAGERIPDTLPDTPTGKSSQTLRAVNAPIVDADDGRAVTPLRAGAGDEP